MITVLVGVAFAAFLAGVWVGAIDRHARASGALPAHLPLAIARVEQRRAMDRMRSRWL